MKIILIYLETRKEINSSAAAKLLEVEIKTASRLLLKAEKLDILKGAGKTKNKVLLRRSMLSPEQYYAGCSLSVS